LEVGSGLEERLGEDFTWEKLFFSLRGLTVPENQSREGEEYRCTEVHQI